MYEGNYQELDTLEKYHVLQQFTQHGIVMNDEEIQTFITTLQGANQKLYDVDLENARRSFVITGLSVRKKQNEHRSALKTKDVEKTYGTVTKLEILKVHQKAYENELKNNCIRICLQSKSKHLNLFLNKKNNLLRIMHK